MKTLETLIGNINGYLYNYIILYIFLIVSIYFTIKLKGVQFRQIFHAAKLLKENQKNPKGISGFKAYCISTASRVGTGNMAGVVTAIVLGGPGALFWMWIMALFGGSLAFVESTLAQLYKEKDDRGMFIGGPSYFIRSKLGKPYIALLFAVLMILAYTAFNGIQANTIAHALVNYDIPKFITAIVLFAITSLVLFNPKRETLTFICSIIVPVMAIPYILIGFIILFININQVPQMLENIFIYAFTGDAVLGAGMGAAVSYGLRRGLFSNEAGMGGAPHAAAAAYTTHPVRQGLLQMFSVFTDTLIICSTSAFILLLSPEAMNKIGTLEGINLLQFAMKEHLGEFGTTFVTICILLFAYSSVLGNFFYIKTGALSIKKSKVSEYIVAFMTLFMVVVGSLLDLTFAWNLGDLFMGLMAIVNIIVIFIMFKPSVSLLKDYEKQLKEKTIPLYKIDNTPDIDKKAITCWDEYENIK